MTYILQVQYCHYCGPGYRYGDDGCRHTPIRKEDKMIETTKFMRRPFPVDGVQVTAENMQEAAAWSQGVIENTSEDGSGANYIKVPVHKPNSPRQERAYVGDWILFAGKGFKVYLDKAFRASFEEIAGAPSVMHGAPSEDPSTPVVTPDGPSPKLMPKRRNSQSKRPAKVGAVGEALQRAQTKHTPATGTTVLSDESIRQTFDREPLTSPTVPANAPTAPAAEPVSATVPVEGPEAVEATASPEGPAPVSNAVTATPPTDGTSTES